MTGPEPDPVVKLQTIIRSVAGARPPKPIAALLNGDTVKPWSEYAVALFELDLPLRVKKVLRQAWQAAARRGITRPREMCPLAPTSNSELHATTVAEFLELLRLVQLRSGLTLSQLSSKAGPGLPRSQAYSMLSRGALPTKPGQVRLFLKTCGLPEDQVDRVLQLWSALREETDRATAARNASEAGRDTETQFKNLLRHANSAKANTSTVMPARVKP